ncbi:hypothetical protein PT2222_70114 [Paraburkholderia tropica]
MSLMSASLHTGQIEIERSPLAQLALREQRAAVALDHGIADRQAKAETLADFARREERFEHAREMLGGDARAVVAHVHVQPLLAPVRAHVDLRGSGAGLVHGQRRVGKEIDEHADDGGFVAEHERVGGQLARERHAAQFVRAEPDRRIERLLEQEGHVVGRGAGLAVREGLEIGDDVLDAVHALLHVRQAFLQRCAVLDLRLLHGDLDRHQAEVHGVVDFVKQPRRQGADRGHLLLLQQLALDLREILVGARELVVLVRDFVLEAKELEAALLVEVRVDGAGERAEENDDELELELARVLNAARMRGAGDEIERDRGEPERERLPRARGKQDAHREDGQHESGVEQRAFAERGVDHPRNHDLRQQQPAEGDDLHVPPPRLRVEREQGDADRRAGRHAHEREGLLLIRIHDVVQRHAHQHERDHRQAARLAAQQPVVAQLFTIGRSQPHQRGRHVRRRAAGRSRLRRTRSRRSGRCKGAARGCAPA